MMSKYAVPLLALASAANAVSLGDVKHVIMVMFENRSFNHVCSMTCDVDCLVARSVCADFFKVLRHFPWR